MKWEFDNNRPIYVQLVETMTLSIIKGEFKGNEKMPSVRSLAEEWKVNPNTVQKAFTELEASGLIRTERTSGRFVTGEPQKIEEMKEALATEKANLYLSQMELLGFTKEKALAYLKRKDKE
ncbi:MAG: GntR family transcriptional regulator [Bacilli bacterium]|nr:GntR family transcriptional regulator [Bacilli bacterium]